MSKKNKKDLEKPIEENLESKQETGGEQLKEISFDELDKELNEIKELLEDQLNSDEEDELSFESEVNQIQELDDIDEILGEMQDDEDDEEDDDEDEDEEELLDLTDVDEELICENCHKRLKSTLYEDDYPFCDACIEELAATYKFPLRILGVLSLVVVLVATFFCGYLSLDEQDTYVSLQNAQTYYDDAMLLSAVDIYNEYLSAIIYSTEENVAVSRKAIKNFAEIFAYNGQYEYAVQVIEMFYDEDALNLPWNSDLKSYITLADELTLISTTLYSTVGEYLDGTVEFDFDEQIAVLEALLEVNPKEEGDSETLESYPQVFIEYYKFIMMSLAEVDYEDQLAQLEIVDSMGDGYEWLYLTDIWAIQMYLGDTESAQEYFERCLESNVQDTTAYYAYASVYRYLEDGIDSETMLEICSQAAAVALDGDYTMNPIFAICYLLEDDVDSAVAAMEEMINGGTYTLQGCNLYALCCYLAGDDDGYDSMIEVLEANGYELSEYVQAYQNGEMTLEEVLSTQGGDI